MAIFEKMNAAIANKDTEAYLDLYGDDVVFVRHQTGTTMDKAQRPRGADPEDGGLRQDGDGRKALHLRERRHPRRAFRQRLPGRHPEAVLMACTVKDGKIRRVETGATPLQK